MQSSALMGSFCWHELLTTDLTGARGFYGELLGWTTVAHPHAEDYFLFQFEGKTMAGLRGLPERVRQAGAPSHWLGHLSVPELGTAKALVQEQGGQLLGPQQSLDVLGNYQRIKDPQGAVLSLLSSCKLSAKASGLGAISWNELSSTDHAAAFAFYQALAGWKETGSNDMGPQIGQYLMFQWPVAKQTMGGMSSVAKVIPGVVPHWLFYASVRDIDKVAETIRKQGGKLLNGPMEVPGGDRVLQLDDPQGATFALHQAAP